jgi:hypothetical protein
LSSPRVQIDPHFCILLLTVFATFLSTTLLQSRCQGHLTDHSEVEEERPFGQFVTDSAKPSKTYSGLWAAAGTALADVLYSKDITVIASMSAALAVLIARLA